MQNLYQFVKYFLINSRNCVHVVSNVTIESVQMRTEVIDIDERAIGGNASAEGGGDEGAEASSRQGVDVVMNSRLVEFTLNKKDYMTHIKEYMARLALRMFCCLVCCTE